MNFVDLQILFFLGMAVYIPVRVIGSRMRDKRDAQDQAEARARYKREHPND